MKQSPGASYDAARARRGQAKKKPTRKAADILIDLSEGAEELFHAPDETAYATIPVDNHLETWPIRSRGFKRWLAREFFAATKSAPNSDAMLAALNVIEAHAHYEGPERIVYIRVGAHEDRLYLDLADKLWRAVEIDEDGWRIVDQSPIPFRRTAGMLALPTPVSGGSIVKLRPFLNLGDKDGNKDFVLAVSFILTALRDRGPYPVLCLAGDHGSAKSTFTAVLRKLIDPNSAPLRALSREDRDLFIAATNAHLLAFDNISHLPDWISDTLCRLATGGGFATRQLYSDQDEQLFDAMRPIILNGIEDIVGRPDLADRAVFLTLEEIADDRRKTELALWTDFKRDHPCILGALLDGVAHGLRRLPDTKLERVPRMADFALWATACETAFWNKGTFANAYGENRDTAVATVIEADLVATAVQKFMAARTQWAGTSSDFLGALKTEAGEDQTRLKEWPPTPRALSARLRRAAATLRRAGVDIAFDRGKRARTITISCLPVKEENFASPPSPSSPANDFNGLGGDAKSGAGNFVSPTNFASPANPLKNKDGDASADGDAKNPSITGGHVRTAKPPFSGRPEDPKAGNASRSPVPLMPGRARELHAWSLDWTANQQAKGLDVSTAILEAELRIILREEAAPDEVEAAIKQVMDLVFMS